MGAPLVRQHPVAPHGGGYPHPLRLRENPLQKIYPRPSGIAQIYPGYPFRVSGGECVSRVISALYR